MGTPSLSFKDKILPIQAPFRDQFKGSDGDFLQAMYESIVRYGGLRASRQEFTIRESDQVSVEEISSSPIQLRLLQSLILLKRPRRILEIGTFIGVSALYMAQVLQDEGQVVTLEKYDHFAAIAQQNFVNNKLDHKIQLIQGDALQELTKMEGKPSFDMVFLDGNKERYLEYFRLIDPLLEVHGLLVVDDIFFHGDVLNDIPRSEKGTGVKIFLTHMEAVRNYHKAILPVGNGIMLALKLGDRFRED